jgi:hypothetical protein
VREPPLPDNASHGKATELADRITEPDIADGVREFADVIGVNEETFSHIASFAIGQ